MLAWIYQDVLVISQLRFNDITQELNNHHCGMRMTTGTPRRCAPLVIVINVQYGVESRALCISSPRGINVKGGGNGFWHSAAVMQDITVHYNEPGLS